MRQVFNLRSVLPRYVATYNVSKVFRYMKTQLTLATCGLKTVSHRFAIAISYQSSETKLLYVLNWFLRGVSFEKLKTVLCGGILSSLEDNAYKDTELRVAVHQTDKDYSRIPCSQVLSNV